MEATYTIALLNQATGAVHHVFTDYRQLQYTKRLHDLGAFVLEVPGTWGLGSESQFLDWRMVVWRKPSGYRRYVDFAGLIRRAAYSYIDGTDVTTLSGFCYNHVLARRVVAYKAGTSQAKKAADAADDIMKELVDENLGSSATDTDRDITSYGFTIQADLSDGTSLAKSCSYDPLLTTLQEIAESSRSTASTAVFFGVVPLNDGYDMEFRTKIGRWGQDHTHPSGADGPVIFALKWGNMADPELVFDRTEERTYTYGLGAGKQSDRLVVTRSDATRIAAGVLNRIESVFDGSNYETTAKLQNATRSRLEEGYPVERFSFSPINLSNCEYGVHWRHGDEVTAVYKGQRYDQHITTVTVTVDENGETIEAKAATWP